MRQTVSMTSTYSSDEFGICSSLYELGGMVVMHDASGCNSTYTTHDEPRWYEMDSMIYISAISEMEAVMGDDQKFIDDVVETARIQKPKFIALVGAPIPYMIGTDFEAIARIVETEIGIPCMGFQANGMNYYTKGISMAMEEMVRRFCQDQGRRTRTLDICVPNAEALSSDNTSTISLRITNELPEDKGISDKIKVNLIGLTPLDFPWVGTVEDFKTWLLGNDMELNVSLSMDCSFEDISNLKDADVNLVVSCGGLKVAQLLKERYGIPYVVGVPYGQGFAAKVAEDIKEAYKSGKDINSYQTIVEADVTGDASKKILLIGEAVTGASLASALKFDKGMDVVVAEPLETSPKLLRSIDKNVYSEDQIRELIAEADVVIADPLYRPLAKNNEFIDMPHTAFSGRIYEKRMPGLIGRPIEF